MHSFFEIIEIEEPVKTKFSDSQYGISVLLASGISVFEGLRDATTGALELTRELVQGGNTTSPASICIWRFQSSNTNLAVRICRFLNFQLRVPQGDRALCR